VIKHMTRSKHGFTAKALAALATVAAFAAAPVALAATDLVVWHAYRGDEKAAFEKVVGMYNAKQKDFVVKTLAVPYDAYADKITASVPRGKGPDVFIFAQDRLGGWVEAGQTIEPIDFFVDEKVTSQFVPGMMPAMTYRDTVYGLPLNFKSIAMIYNTALVKAPPKTTGELVKVAKGLTNAPSGRFGLAYEYSNFFFHAALMNAHGGQVFAPGPKPVIDSPQNIAAVKTMMKWYKTDGILPADPSSTLIASLFNEGKAAIVFSGPWFLGEVQDKVKYAIAPLPTVDEAGGKPMKPWLTVEGVYVSAGSKQKEGAYKFAEYLVSTEAALVLALEGGQLPTNKAAYADPRIVKNPTLQGFRKQLDTAVPMPNYAEMTLMWSPVTTAMNKIVKGSATPEVALKEAQATVTDSIAKLRKGR
jgi:arabinogalactan oligomer/maltooligosaccharide transport system substrate-binding protein